MKEQNFLNTVTQRASHYTPGEQVNEEGWIKLNTNESPLPASPQVFATLKALASQVDVLRKYSHPLGEPLLSALAAHWGIDKSSLVVTNGSDEALTLLCRATLDAERSAAFPEVTYSLYKTLVTNAGASYTEVPVIPSDNQPYGVDVAALENSAAQVVFLANPNAITGEYIPREKLKATLAQSHKLWIIDEAYNDFAGHDATMLPFVPDLKNLVVTRTFSKTHALAGLRVGYLATSNHALLNGLMAHKDSYNEDALATRLAKVALNDTAWHQKTLDAVREGHAYLFNTLASMGFTPYTSSANFLLVKVPPPVSAEALAQKLRDYKLLIRYYPNSKFSDCVRISVGAMEENQKLIAAIGSIYAHAQ